jgi:DNA-directed RNA polymerase specialized sigma24 family protein
MGASLRKAAGRQAAMVWQEAFPPTDGPAFDAEAERERRLAAQARVGAEWALTALIARYQPTVVRYLTRLCGNQTQARLLAERIFQRMERRLHGPHGAENLRLWLLRACTEAGLDSLRRPHSRATPRLAGTNVAGLLAEQSDDASHGFLHGGLRRLRQATGGSSRQAQPLVWANDAAPTDTPHTAGDSTRATADGHIDETLDRLDPRDALRHRLVRVTLAELPYGDAQCLALHLVAGLNQAEVAKSLGITNSAARKRIVHGLALFSDRYSQAVRSLGLPMELGFGDAIPQAPAEPIAEPAPEPVVISSRATDDAEDVASDDDNELTEREDRLIAVNPSSDRGRDLLAGVSYYTDDSGELAAVMPQTSEPETLYGAGPLDMDDTQQPAHLSANVAGDDAPAEAEQTLLAAQDLAPASGGLITRVASDAIIGPIVDALPVTAASPDAPGTFGLASPRSTPLTYELSSHSLPLGPSASDIHMNWLDEAGLMTPLSFEAVAMPAAVAVTSLDEDAPLGFEASASRAEMFTAQPPTPAEDDAPLAYELAQAPTANASQLAATADSANTAESARSAGALIAEPQRAEPLALVAEAVAPSPVIVPILTPVTVPVAAETVETEPETFGPRAIGGVITRSLEDLWNELPDIAGH